jgi:ATP-dependent helicase/nuclease subunit A
MQNVPPPDGVVRRYLRREDTGPIHGAAAPPVVAPDIALPGWLRSRGPAEASLDSAWRPSEATAEGSGVKSSESAEGRARALQRGSLVHRLLQSLPDMPAGQRQDAALRYLGRNAGAWTDGEREALAAELLALIADPRFAVLFGPGSRAEVSIVGRLERPGRPPALVSGQIDRLVVTASEILIVDYKTNHAPPQSAALAPPTYVRQLALYRGVLTRLYPELPVRAALLWTETPEMMEISAPALDARLTAIIRGGEHP